MLCLSLQRRLSHSSRYTRLSTLFRWTSPTPNYFTARTTTSPIRALLSASTAANLTSAKEHTTASSSGDVNNLDKQDEKEFPFVWARQWYPLLPIDHLLQQSSNHVPKQLTVLGRNLVIWKSGNNNDNGNTQWTVMEDICPHRRAPLSTGKVLSHDNNDSGSGCSTGRSNTLMCRFHGWEFDATGACTKIPMQPPDAKGKDIKHTKTTQATTFRTQVQGGLLWAFLDETMYENPPELSPDAYVEGDGSHMEYLVTVSPVSYLSLVENSFDPAHAPFIHEGVSEFGGRVFSPEIALAMEGYGFQNGTTSTLAGFTLEHGKSGQSQQSWRCSSNHDTAMDPALYPNYQIHVLWCSFVLCPIHTSRDNGDL